MKMFAVSRCGPFTRHDVTLVGKYSERAAGMIKFTFLPPADIRLAPEHRAQYLTIREVVKWEFSDETDQYSGLLIIGEQIIGIYPPPPDFEPSSNMTVDFTEKQLSPTKIHQICSIVRTGFFDPYISVHFKFESPTIQ